MMRRMLIVGLVAAMTATLNAAPEALAAHEFAKYCRQITGREPPPATFAVDAALDGRTVELKPYELRSFLKAK